MENSETIVGLDFAYACGYISQSEHAAMISTFEEVGRMLNHVLRNPGKFK